MAPDCAGSSLSPRRRLKGFPHLARLPHIDTHEPHARSAGQLDYPTFLERRRSLIAKVVSHVCRARGRQREARPEAPRAGRVVASWAIS